MTENWPWAAPGQQQPQPPYAPQQPYPPQQQFRHQEPYSPQPSQQQPYYGGFPPQRTVWQAVKPGVLALKPLAFGDFFSGPVAVMRHNPKGTILVSLLAHVIALLLAVPVGLGVARAVGTSWVLGADPSSDQGFFLPLAASYIPFALATALVAPVVFQTTHAAMLGDKPDLGVLWASIQGRILPYLGTILLVAVVVGAPLILVGAAVGVAIYLLTQGDSSGSNTALVLVVVLLGLVGVYGWFGYSSTKCVAAPAECVWSGRGPLQSIKASWALSQGSFWRILGAVVLVNMVISIFTSMIATPINLVIFWVALGGMSNSDGATALSAIASVLSYVVPSILTAPLSAILAGLITLDLKFRREGYDVSLLNRLAR